MHSLKSIAETVTAFLVPFTPDALTRSSEILPQELWPTTVDEAVDSLLARMSAQDKAMVRATRREDLIIFQHGWGGAIRSYYGLEDGNWELLIDSCGKQVDASRAASKIIEAVWTELQHS
ncbi:MAG: DUF6794 domain-containing protein [Pseudomonadota bacterium]